MIEKIVSLCLQLKDIGITKAKSRNLMKTRMIRTFYNDENSYNPPFQDKRCENGSLLLFEMLHF